MMGVEKTMGAEVAEAAIKRVCAGVLPRIKPGRGEAFAERLLADRIMERLRATLPRDVEVELAGSIAKGTNLRGDRDFDVFILFPRTYSRRQLETLGLQWAKRAVAPHPWAIGYAEHPYLRASLEACDVDIVPGYKIEEISEKATSVDRSPLHTKWVKERLNEAMCDEVRLLKAFLKGIGVYGAELRVEGFSGYLCELLIAHYGSFAAVIRAASEWRRPVIDVEKHYDERALGQKFPSPMVVVDPVDRERNVAAVVSETSLARFVYAARAFLRKPSERFFFPKRKEPTLARLRKALGERKLLLLLFRAPAVVPDILWPQLRKAANSMAKRLEADGFRLIGNGWWSDEKRWCILLFEFEVAELSQARKARGPDVWHASDLDAFVAAHARALSGPFIEGTKAVAIERRRHASASSLLKEVAAHPAKYALPSHIAASLGKGYRLVEGREALKEDACVRALGAYLEKRML